MNWTVEGILQILDQCAKEFNFPVLDNGYVYLAATKLSVYRSKKDWAIVIEVFGFSPRSGNPDIQIYTFSSSLFNRNPASNYVSEVAYEKYLRKNPYNESRFVYPIENNDWQDDEDLEYIKETGSCCVRGAIVLLPSISEYEEFGINLEEGRPLTFEFCRYLAEKYRDDIFCTESERRVSVRPEMELLLQLDEWSHPDIAGEELPSSSKTFYEIAKVIVTGDVNAYKNTAPQNTHWVNWPEAGTL